MSGLTVQTAIRDFVELKIQLRDINKIASDIRKRIRELEPELLNLMAEAKLLEVTYTPANVIVTAEEVVKHSMGLKWVKTVLLSIVSNRDFSLWTPEVQLERILNARIQKKKWVLKLEFLKDA